jgi:hypothetical protein
MKKTEINPKVIEMLNDFENLEAMDASEAWNQALMQKLVESDVKHSSNLALPVSYVTVIVIFILMNAVCIFNGFKKLQPSSFNRIAKLNIISKELLIPNVTFRE